MDMNVGGRGDVALHDPRHGPDEGRGLRGVGINHGGVNVLRVPPLPHARGRR